MLSTYVPKHFFVGRCFTYLSAHYFPNRIGIMISTMFDYFFPSYFVHNLNPLMAGFVRCVTAMRRQRIPTVNIVTAAPPKTAALTGIVNYAIDASNQVNNLSS